MHFKFKMDVLLYSKFSPASKQLMLQLQQTPELLESLTITCIDNKLIRKQILSDEKVKINHLPCFIRLNDQTGNFDIYEGQNAFDFFTTLQTQFKQPVSQNYNFTQPQPPIPQKYQEPENENENEYENEYENEPIQPPMPQKQTKQNIKQKAQQEESQRHQSELKDMKRKEEFIKNQSKDTNRKAPPTVKNKLSTSLKTVTFTPIEDLELENLQDIDELEDNEEKDGENDENDNKDDKELSTSISTYTHIPKNVNSEFSEREVRSKQAEMNASKNTGSILSKAMKMQKERA